MYKVQIVGKATGYKTVTVNGIYIESETKRIPVEKMKTEALQYIVNHIKASNPVAELFKFQVNEFKKMKCDFIYKQRYDKNGKELSGKEGENE